MPAARRQPSRSELERIIANLRADNARLLAQQSSSPPAPLKIALKLAAYNADLDPERLRRWCVAGIVRSEKIGGQWFVDKSDLARRMHSLTG
jgi:hypothetical protein